MKSLRESARNSGSRPLRIFVDANTVVSGLLFEGNEAVLLRLGRIGACKLMATRHVMDEVASVLQTEEFNLTQDEIESLTSFANKWLHVHENSRREEIRKYISQFHDKKDAHVWAGFEKLVCDVLVTGDKELLKKIPGARTTRQTLNLLLSEK